VTTRLALINLMKQVLAGDQITDAELSASVPDPTALDRNEQLAWQRLSQWADDDDIRVNDEAYSHMQRRHVAEALADLEALEAGYDPREIKRGEHRATHIPLLGCVVVMAILAVLFYAMFAHGFFMHGD
jgi:hypothetical protein